ncbi:MAG: DUF177 domain-containing protein [Geminicoccaceae bacterium]
MAKRLDLVDLSRLEARMHLSHGPRKGIYILRGHFEAEARQSCVVTFEPVDVGIEIPFERYFSLEEERSLPRSADAEPEEILVNIDNEEPEPIHDKILDVGEIVVEELSLALDPYPRSPEAEEVMNRFRAADEESAGPFARLRRLRGGGS